MVVYDLWLYCPAGWGYCDPSYCYLMALLKGAAGTQDELTTRLSFIKYIPDSHTGVIWNRNIKIIIT